MAAGHGLGAAHRWSLRGALWAWQRTTRRRGTARPGACACGVVRPGIHRRPDRGSVEPCTRPRRPHRRHRGGARGAHLSMTDRDGGASVAKPKHGRRLTVQGWQNLVLSAMALVVLTGLVAGGLLMTRTDQLSREVIDNIQPARVQAYALQAALRDQETAVRGYVITADKQFLDPYYAGLDAERQAAQNIRERVGTRSDLMADLDQIQDAAAAWRM